MADLKISQLNSIVTVVPATDVLPVVQGGTTLKITPKQILESGSPAVLASATITGAATVGTTLGVTGASTLDSATLSGNLTVRTTNLVVTSTGVGMGTATPSASYFLDLTTANDARARLFVADTAFLGSGNLANGFVIRTLSSSTDGIKFTNYAQSTEFMRIDSTGLGIGVSPSYKLQAQSTADGICALLTRGGGTNTPQLRVSFADATVTTTLDANSGAGSPVMSLAVNGTSRMLIDSSGNVGIGVTPTTSRLLLKGNGTNIPVKIVGTTGDTTIPHLVIDKKDNNTTTSQLFIQFVVADNGAGSGQINANGVNQAAFGTYSDSRLKKNIVSLPSQLANILSLRPVEFDYKDGNGHQIGFIAQEMQEVYADAVGEQEGFLTVSGWNKTEARLVSAMKELAAKVQALEAKLA